MVRSDIRDYTKENVLRVLNFISENEPVNINEVIFYLGPKIPQNVEDAVQTLFDENVIGSREAFLKTQINFSPWDTIIYDGIADSFIGVDENNNLYLKDKVHNKYNSVKKENIV